MQRLSDRLREDPAEPVAHLVVEELWLAVVDGSLEIGKRLPTARQLAIALGVSPRSIERAYTELERRGVVATRPGQGSFVSLTQPPEHERARHQELANLCRETVQRARELGFDIQDVLDALAEFRSGAQETQTQEPGP
ncbi:MAG TPA: GntR family transcriptional regulator [Longimicrobiales bacterium]|nr:GntR family transcriptional regulator [Longimicrobiales bacterium]